MYENRGQRISALKQFCVLTRQYILILGSDRKNLLIMILFPVIASFITVWIAGQNMFYHYEGTKSGCFVLVSAAIWGGLFNSIQTVVKERSSIKRDYLTGLRIRCYTESRAIIQLFMCMLQSMILCTAFVGVSLFRGNDLPTRGVIFQSALFEYYVSILLLMYAADMMGLMISSIVRKTETANVMAPYILIVQLIFSGILFEMKGTAKIVSYFMLSRWGMESLGSISNLNKLPLRMELEMADTGVVLQHEAETMFKHTDSHLLLIWLILLGFSLVFALLGNLFLHGVSRDTR